MNAEPIDKNANTAAYHRPPWMTDDAQWQQVSADLTEQWLTLLERAAREINVEQQRRA